MRYSTATLWPMYEVQKKITLFQAFILYTSGFYFQANVQLFAVDSYRNVGKNPQVNLDMTLLKTAYKKTSNCTSIDITTFIYCICILHLSVLGCTDTVGYENHRTLYNNTL